ncbi:hypothetical protein [Pelomonas sp. KK5]|uniref:hypothetical protein n=1 Tax=Pelomonas sp. KK5 TaxID=1855730 RepID=UPI00097BC1B6|nr:hypothetical protein [Pelomonas sp. KK5]
MGNRVIQLAWWGLLALGLCSPVAAQEPARIWRVCITDLVLPPYLSNDPAQPGIAERLLVEAGRQSRLSVLLLRYPMKRCVAMADSGSADAALAAPTPDNVRRLEFPMRAGVIDSTRRVARINLVWVARQDANVQWNGGLPAGRLVVGTRLGMRSAIEPLQAAGFQVDATASTIGQLLHKVAARRVDLAVGLQEEVEYALHGQPASPLMVLPTAFLTTDFYAVVPRRATPPGEAVEAWWSAMGRLRELPEFRPR